MNIDDKLKLAHLDDALAYFFDLARTKIKRLHNQWDPRQGSPVFTRKGKYTTRGWTEWTQGFMYGCQILQFDATGDDEFLIMGRTNTVRHMAPHVSHIGVHDHGFNNVSTYGNLRRLALEGRTDDSQDAVHFYEMALKVSGAVQAARWSTLADGTGFIHSFNGPHSLFSDTIRSCRALIVADQLGHVLMGENDARYSLLERAVEHIYNTARYNVYFGTGRDIYDVSGRVVHESIFNMKDGRYRCPSTQQGYSPFSTWTRGLAWVILGAAEQLEFFDTVGEDRLGSEIGATITVTLLDMAKATADFYLANTPTDGIPYWDTGAPGLAQMGDYLNRPAEPDNAHEPVDSSAAAITAQGLLRLGRHLGIGDKGKRYYQAGLSVARTLLQPPYLSEDRKHHGLLLHSVYHRPNGWDYIPPGKAVPQGESSMWGDYHVMELAVYLQREIAGGDYLKFFD
ncbi:MAG: glycoside hydrolase family 88 protein [Candidatus Hydrogenedentes bacterium]|nr:glycoside hydrolase family 88 protein [Candidatus Hydrogenedentota bacterium]